MSDSAFIELRNYLRLQAALVARLRVVAEAEESLAASLNGLPRMGFVELAGERWSYTRHGVGVAFRHERAGCVVDVHEHVDQPVVFDAWRLRTYFGSLGRRGVKLVSTSLGKAGLPLEEAIALLLDTWLSEDKIARRMGNYVLQDAAS